MSAITQSRTNTATPAHKHSNTSATPQQSLRNNAAVSPQHHRSSSNIPTVVITGLAPWLYG
ncbi:MAG: hypothetical protein HOP01_02255 [Gallionella sp.]|nr:hypothetical protein [Gallionella sp.]